MRLFLWITKGSQSSYRRWDGATLLVRLKVDISEGWIRMCTSRDTLNPSDPFWRWHSLRHEGRVLRAVCYFPKHSATSRNNAIPAMLGCLLETGARFTRNRCTEET